MTFDNTKNSLSLSYKISKLRVSAMHQVEMAKKEEAINMANQLEARLDSLLKETAKLKESLKHINDVAKDSLS